MIKSLLRVERLLGVEETKGLVFLDEKLIILWFNDDHLSFEDVYNNRDLYRHRTFYKMVN